MNNTVEKHLGVLDGIRAISILFVVWFHFWQQTWITPYIDFDTSWTRYLGITECNLAGFVRYGFQFVDMLILLSAVCNFYPYARSILLGEPWPDAKTFYKKRAVRILPSYLLCVVIMLVVALLEGRYTDPAFMARDILGYLTFTSMFNRQTFLGTQLNVVLWTVQIEVLYYLVLPWLAKLFKKLPAITCGLLWLCSILMINFIVYNHPDEIQFYVNSILTFAGVYANGMLVCMVYVTVKKHLEDNPYLPVAATLGALACIVVFNSMLKTINNDTLQLDQIQMRMMMSLVFSCFILCALFACKWFQALFSNRLMRFIAAISYNLYIWHQVIAVKCKVYKLPYWEGTDPPNMTGDIVWQWKYQAIILGLSLAVAILLTYGFELPAAKYLRKKLHI